MICETNRNPFRLEGSTVTRNSGVSTIVLVTGVTVMLACEEGAGPDPGAPPPPETDAIR